MAASSATSYNSPSGDQLTALLLSSPKCPRQRTACLIMIIMDHALLEHGVHYEQPMLCTEVQEQNTLQIQDRQTFPPSHTLPDNSIITNLSHPVEQWNPQKSPHLGHYPETSGRPGTAVWCRRTKSNQKLSSCSPKLQGGNPLSHETIPASRHWARDMRVFQLSSDAALPGLLQSRIKSSLSARAQAVHRGEPSYI